MHNSTKIVHSALTPWNNTGDRAIIISMAKQIREQIPDVEISILSMAPDKIEESLGIPAISPNRIFTVLNTIRKTDILICGGGGILQDQTSVFNIPAHIGYAVTAVFLKKKVMLYAVGAGPINTIIGKLLTRLILLNVKAITVRDEGSKEVLSNLCADLNKIQVTADPAINLLPCSEERTEDILVKEGIPFEKPLIGVCLRHWFDTHYLIPVNIAQKYKLRPAGGKQKYEKFVKDIAVALDMVLDKRDVNILFIPFWRERDDMVHRHVIENMRNTASVYRTQNAYSPDEILKIVSKTDIIIGMRLHSLIFAASCKIPMIALGYAPKVTNFMSSMNQQNMAISLEKINPIELANLVDKTLHSREDIQIAVGNAAEELKLRERENLRYLKELLTSSQA